MQDFAEWQGNIPAIPRIRGGGGHRCGRERLYIAYIGLELQITGALPIAHILKFNVYREK